MFLSTALKKYEVVDEYLFEFPSIDPFASAHYVVTAVCHNTLSRIDFRARLSFKISFFRLFSSGCSDQGLLSYGSRNSTAGSNNKKPDDQQQFMEQNYRMQRTLLIQLIETIEIIIPR
jgi:hypothetical protein